MGPLVSAAPLSALRAPIRHAQALSEGLSIALDAAQVAGLKLREVQEKEAFTLADNTGAYFRASLKRLAAAGGEALVYERMPASPESPAELSLFCAILARQRMLMLIQKATELGVSRVVPVFSQHSVQADGLEHEKAHAWPKQAVRAARQCRRASLPEVHEPVPLSAALQSPSFVDADVRLSLDDRIGVAALAPFAPRGAPVRVAFVVGPEGGFSDDERSLLVESGARALRLGGRILRAETAVFAGLTLLQHVYGDM